MEKNFIELTNNSGFKLDSMTFRIQSIEAVLQPQKQDCGCIVVVNGIKYPVKESYSEVCFSLNTRQ